MFKYRDYEAYQTLGFDVLQEDLVIDYFKFCDFIFKSKPVFHIRNTIKEHLLSIKHTDWLIVDYWSDIVAFTTEKKCSDRTIYYKIDIINPTLPKSYKPMHRFPGSVVSEW